MEWLFDTVSSGANVWLQAGVINNRGLLTLEMLRCSECCYATQCRPSARGKRTFLGGRLNPADVWQHRTCMDIDRCVCFEAYTVARVSVELATIAAVSG